MVIAARRKAGGVQLHPRAPTAALNRTAIAIDAVIVGKENAKRVIARSVAKAKSTRDANVPNLRNLAPLTEAAATAAVTTEKPVATEKWS